MAPAVEGQLEERRPRRLRRRLVTLAGTFREVGVGGAGYLLWQRSDPRWGHLDWFRVFVDEGPGRPGTLPFRWVAEGDVDLVAAGTGASPDLVRRRLALGDRCALVEEDGRFVANVWFVTRRPYDEGGLLFGLRPGDVWLYDAAVAPAFRGRRVFPRLVEAAIAELRGSGAARRAVWTVDRLNLASLRASDRLGTAVATVVKLRIGPLSVARIGAAEGRRPRWRLFGRRLDVPVPESWTTGDGGAPPGAEGRFRDRDGDSAASAGRPPPG